jgi:HK97 family phage portal protein
MARKSLGLAMAMETFGSKFFGEGTHPSGIITQAPGIKQKDPGAVRKALSSTYAGLGKSHRLMLLEDGMAYQSIGIPPEDSQFLESRQFQIPEIARWFNLPPHKLKDLTKSSFNNIEQEQISFVTDSILPWLIDFEQEYHSQLLTDAQRYGQKLYFKHVVEGLLRADAKSRAEFYQIMKRNGLMTINEIRGKEDLNPHTDPLADELWTEINLSPLSKFDENFGQKEPEQELLDDKTEPKPRNLKAITGG